MRGLLRVYACVACVCTCVCVPARVHARVRAWQGFLLSLYNNPGFFDPPMVVRHSRDGRLHLAEALHASPALKTSGISAAFEGRVG